MYNKKLIKKGSESELYLIDWYGIKAISKIRVPKKYRYPSIDFSLRKQRTIHEANIMSIVKTFDVHSPFIYFVDSYNFEIVMELIPGKLLKDIFSSTLSMKLGEVVARLHSNNIIHGDITTSNFILRSNDELVAIDFGLSFFSERFEDKATDIRLFKQILNSVHVDLFKDSFDHFCTGYKKTYGQTSHKILDIVSEIEKRGRYSRTTL
jgi:TP53 regulating kinase-like protein